MPVLNNKLKVLFLKVAVLYSYFNVETLIFFYLQ